MRYAMHTVTDLEMPARQCTRHLPPDAAALSMNEMASAE